MDFKKDSGIEIAPTRRNSRALPCFPANVEPDDASKALLEEGFLVVESALQPHILSCLEAELEPWFSRALTGEGMFLGRGTKRFSALFAKSAMTKLLAIDPLTLELADRVLRASGACETFEINLTQAIGIEPGEPAQILHRDEDIWPISHDREVMLNAIWMLDDFTEENGATRLIPGSHKWPRTRHPEPGEAVYAEAPAGSLLVFLGSTLHGGGANRSRATRRGILLSYRVAWLAPTEKLLLSIPQDVVRTLPRRLQRLIGYQLHRPNLGWIECRDPIEWLDGKFRDIAPASDNLPAYHSALLEELQRYPERYTGYLT
ncbi:MAG TPA: phytanoyl-CoA dioxygenase family protein [Rhizomicrobium sp.]|nr:phytanoyl-CoA dioxygenase family protein [Rhizomicrobium sp.]